MACVKPANHPAGTLWADCTSLAWQVWLLCSRKPTPTAPPILSSTQGGGVLLEEDSATPPLMGLSTALRVLPNGGP